MGPQLAGFEARRGCGGRKERNLMPATVRHRQLELASATSARPFFTERTLADHLAVSDRTVRTWIRRGELASYKLGGSRRIDPRDVDTFLAARRENGRAA